MSKRSELRQQLAEQIGWICEYPGCRHRWTELAHLHSIGMGGRKSADTEDNVALFCYDHARLSDGSYGTRTRRWYEDELWRINCVAEDGAWEIAETLRVVIGKRRLERSKI